jgi:hypothetical protein
MVADIKYLVYIEYSISQPQNGYSKMTPSPDVAIRSRMGRKKRWHEPLLVKFPAGTRERIAPLLGETEDRTDFVREAVEREIRRRETAKPKKPARRR